MSARDDLVDLLMREEHAPPETHGLQGECLCCPWPLHGLRPAAIAAAILAAGWRPPARVIEPGPNQAAELDALPAGTVVRRDRDGYEYEGRVMVNTPEGEWRETGSRTFVDTLSLAWDECPWTVLHEGDGS